MPEGVQPYTRAERLLNLVMALRGTRTGLSREQVRAVVRGYDPDAADDAFERMFERDKDELRSMGIPVVTMTDPSGVVTGYRVERDWAMPPIDLDRSQLAVLGLAARVWQSAELGPAALNALRKVEARLGMVTDDPVAAPIAGLSADSPALPGLISACSQRVAVEFRYRKGASAEPQPRRVHPWGVVWWRAHWYLVGHDVDRDDVRVFRTSRIDGAVRVVGPPGQFTVPEGFDPRAAIGRFSVPGGTELTVALAPGTGAALRRRATATGTDDAGWDLLSLPADTLPDGVAAVLALGPAARVLGPAEAVALAVDELDAVIAALTSDPPRAGRPLQRPGARGPAGAQFSRLLALVPWLAANSGVSVAAAAEHFGISEEQLRSDLGSVITSGADDWTLFDIQYWDEGGTIEVIDALELAEPLTLTPDEGFALLVALHALDAVPGDHDRAALRSTMAVLGQALGAAAPAPGAVSVRVDLPSGVVEGIEAAAAAGRALDLTYLGAVRDAVTERTVDPVGVVVVDGYAYLRAHCRRAEGLRLFRLDRILDLRVSAEAAQPVAEAPAEVEPMASLLADSGLRIVVDVPAGSSVPDRHPVTRGWSLPGGGQRLEMPVGDYGWARRLVLGGAGSVALREPEWLVEQLLEDARAARDAHTHA